ncbi:MAG: alpha/beta hydrolase-fold protein [Pseudomonadota bacterium]
MRNFITLVALAMLAACSTNGQRPLFAGNLDRLGPFDSAFVPARDVDVWTPPGYPNGAPYDVLYMHDGQNLFDATTTWNGLEWRVDETATALIQTDRTRPFIVVAIHNADNRRHAEYFPEKPWRRIDESTRNEYLAVEREPGVNLFETDVDSDNYLKFLVNELKPYIDREYAVAITREHTFVAGSSMGGLISLYALAEYPDIFGGAACLSTHWLGTWTEPQNPHPDAFLAYFRDALPAPGTHKIYFDHGDLGLDAYYGEHQARVDEMMGELGFTAPNWVTRTFEDADHSETAWARRLKLPLTFLMGER